MAVRKKGSPFLIGIIFAVVGIGVLLFGVKIREKGKATLSWTETKGTVICSEIDRSKNSDGKTMYSATIETEYVVSRGTYVKGLFVAGVLGASLASKKKKASPVSVQQSQPPSSGVPSSNDDGFSV